MKLFIGIFAICSAGLAANSTVAQSQVETTDGTARQEAPVKQPDGFRAVRDGMAAEMGKAAEHLSADGERRPATEALDRALHLGEFAKRSAEPGGTGASAFHDALEAVHRARHEIQVGRPRDAIRILQTGTENLKQADASDAMPASAGSRPLEGLTVLNMHGHRLGEVERLEEQSGKPVAMVGHGGFWNMGETITPVPANSLLAGKHFAVLPSDVSPEEFKNKR